MDVVFQKGSEVVITRIENKKITFSRVQGQYLKFSNIDGLKFSIAGILEEFPDLKEKSNNEIRQIGIQRFKDHIASLKNDEEVKDYLIKDLRKHGYYKKYEIKKGHRPRK